MSPPMPRDIGNAWLKRISKDTKTKSALSLRKEFLETLLSQMTEHNVNTLFLQEEPDLEGWNERGIQTKDLLIGDVEYEVCQVHSRGYIY